MSTLISDRMLKDGDVPQARISPIMTAGRVLLLTGAFFGIIFSHYLFKAVNSALTIKLLGAKGIPLIDALLTVLSLIISALVLKTGQTHRVRLSTLTSFLAVGAVAILLISPWMIALAQFALPVLYLLSLAGQTLMLVGVYSAWTLLTSVLPRVTWKEITVFGCGAQIAVIMASWTLRWGAAEVPVVHLLVWAGLGYAGAFSAIILAMRSFSFFGVSSFSVGNNYDLPRNCGSLMDEMSSLLKVPYMRYMILLILLQCIVTDCIQWRIYIHIEKAPTLQSAAIMLSKYYEYLGYVSLACQVILVPIIYRYLRPTHGIVILPVVAACVAAVLATGVGSPVVFAAIASFRSLDYTVNNCMREALFIPLPLHTKVLRRGVFSMAMPKIGTVASSAIILLIGTANVFPWAIGLAITGWLATSFMISKRYADIETTPVNEVLSSIDEVR